MESMHCIICDADFTFPHTDRYSGCVCPQCGQVFQYDENIMITLSDEQIDVLRARDKRMNVGPKTEYWGLTKALKIIEDQQEFLENENNAAIDNEDTQCISSLSQQIIVVNALHKRIQTAVIEAGG